jgi:hypothetical protein
MKLLLILIGKPYHNVQVWLSSVGDIVKKNNAFFDYIIPLIAVKTQHISQRIFQLFLRCKKLNYANLSQ